MRRSVSSLVCWSFSSACSRASRGGEWLRRRPGVDVQGIAYIIQAVSELVTDFPEITEVDLNPVIATTDTAVAVDALVVVATHD